MTATLPAQTATRRAAVPAWLGVVALAVLVVAVYAAAGWDHRAPRILADEAGTLGNARWLVGGELWPMRSAADTEIGYPLLLAPLVALVDEPRLLFRAVMLLNALFTGAITVMLYAIARLGLGATHGRALVGAGCAMAYPALAVQVGIAWVETAAVLAFTAFALTAVLVLRRPGAASFAAHSVVTGLLSSVHGRFLLLPLLWLGACVLVLATRPVLRRAAAAGLAITVVVTLALRALGAAVYADRWESTASQPVRGQDLLEALPFGVLRSLAGQGWYLVAATGGLAVLGLLALVLVFAGRGPDRGPAARPDRGGSEPLHGWAAGAYVGLSVLAVYAASSVFMASFLARAPTNARVDQVFYGRYNEAFVPLLLALGVAAALDPRWRSRVLPAQALAVVAGPALLAVALVLKGDARYTGKLNPQQVAGLHPWLQSGEDYVVRTGLFMLPAAVAAALVAALLLVLIRRARPVLPVVVVTLFAVTAYTGATRLTAGYDRFNAAVPGYVALREIAPDRVLYDLDNYLPYGFYALPFWLDRSTYDTFRSTQGWPEAQMYIGPRNWPEAQARGLRRAAVDELSNQGFWVPPTP